MKIADTVSSIITFKKHQNVWSAAPNDSVFSAIELMAEKNIGALPVIENKRLVGIISERDYTRKVILKNRSSKSTSVREIMTSRVYTISLDTKVSSAMELMTEKFIRHLPIVEDGFVVGMISIGDLVRRTISAQGALIDQLESYLTNSYPA